MTDKEIFDQIASALIAVADGCAKYMSKNPNAKYTDATGKERPIAYAIDIARNHARNLKEVTSNDGSGTRD